MESEKKGQLRSVRKICDTCSKYLDYGELRYDKMEDGIRELQKTGTSTKGFSDMLFGVLNESLDEDQTAIEYFTRFSESSLARPMRPELDDFITIGKLVTLKQIELLENAGMLLVEKYTNSENVTDTLSNLYLKDENEASLPVFQKLIEKATGLYPDGIALESLRGFLYIKGKEYAQALQSFLIIRDRIEQDKENPYFNFNMASTYDSIAGCFLKLGDAEKTIENCDHALHFDNLSEEYKMGAAILHKKADALILAGRKEEALALTNQILEDIPDDEIAMDLKNRAIM